MIPANDQCPSRAKVTDEDLASVVRAGLAHKTGKGLVVDVADDCLLIAGHEVDCAAYIASLGAYPASAWLRWGHGRPRVDWLADCPADGCALFLGHPGDCHPCGVPRGDRRWSLDAR